MIIVKIEMFVSEWMEFSPYEIGMPKYGTFMKPELFGSKFFIGHLVKKYEEPPLHFLQGKVEWSVFSVMDGVANYSKLVY